MNYRKIRRKQKVGETLPAFDIPIEAFSVSIHRRCPCSKPYIIRKPKATVEKLPRYYEQFCFSCLNCNWEGIELLTRTQ